MAVKEKQTDSHEKIEWTPENEIQLFFAMNGHKPVGINKYFHMVCIWEKFRAAINKDVSLKVIWEHLESLYDLVALDDVDDFPFPVNKLDFSLSETDFPELKNKKKEEPELKLEEKTEPKAKQKEVKKEKEIKETVKKETPSRESKTVKEQEKKKEESKKVVKEPEVKKEKQKETKEVKKEVKSSKTRPKGKDDIEDTGIPLKKERKDSESSRSETPKRVVLKRTRQSTDGASKATSSPRDTPPLKQQRRR